MNAGADVFATDEILNKIKETQKVEFSRIVATQDSIKRLTHLAKVLGPLGLFPNKKSGTLVAPAELEETIRMFKQGIIELRSDPHGQVRCNLGKKSFETKRLVDNFDAILAKVSELKAKDFKGRLVKKAVISASFGPGYKIDVANIPL